MMMAEKGIELEGREQRSHDLSSPSEERNKLTYLITDAPPWYLCIFFAIQVGVVPPALNFVKTLLRLLCNNFGSFVFVINTYSNFGCILPSPLFYSPCSIFWQHLGQRSQSLSFFLRGCASSTTTWPKLTSWPAFSSSRACVPCCRSPLVSGKMDCPTTHHSVLQHLKSQLRQSKCGYNTLFY